MISWGLSQINSEAVTALCEVLGSQEASLYTPTLVSDPVSLHSRTRMYTSVEGTPGKWKEGGCVDTAFALTSCPTCPSRAFTIGSDGGSARLRRHERHTRSSGKG